MLEARKANARVLFDGRQHYEIPVFQRPYVWTEDAQWEPLWLDVVRVSESHIPAAGKRSTASHFLGAVVFEAKRSSSSSVSRLDVIDGQQRLTTLQLLLDAVQAVISSRGFDRESRRIEDLILNSAPEFSRDPERFKLWPSRLDRPAFEHAMDPTSMAPSGESLITDAHAFFTKRATRWISGLPDEIGDIPPGDEHERVEQLCETLLNRLMLVSIDLTDDEDSQLIFETLNDRGTPLLKADLIKNWVFRRGMDLHADVDAWAEQVWNDFDGDWWRDEIAQGRISRSRIDIFLQYWLTMRTLDEVKTELVFREFEDHASKHMTTLADAERFLRELRADAETYQRLAELDADTASGRFRVQVIEAMELAATMPVFLWFISSNHAVPQDQVDKALGALESWATRRTLLRLTSKDVNRHMVALLKELADVSPEQAGDQLVLSLSRQTADSRYWPTDEEVDAVLPTAKLYSSLKQSRIRAVLATVERALRDQAKTEAVVLPSGLTIEHIMPQEWRVYWDPKPRLEPIAAAARDLLVDSIGNLTLVTGPLNSSLKHSPWTDQEARGLKQGGPEGKGKRSLLNDFSLLAMNRRVVDEHLTAWTEDDIRRRGAEITQIVRRVWPGPDVSARDGEETL